MNFFKLLLLSMLLFCSFMLSSCGGGSDEVVEIEGGGEEPEITNIAPTSNSGPDQYVTSGQHVLLVGSGFDSDGSIIEYLWSPINGTALPPVNPTNESSSFTAPTVDEVTLLTFSLTVTDNDGATSVDETVVIVVPTPIAASGIDQEVYSKDTVNLIGSGVIYSGSVTNYQWNQVGGNDFNIQNPTSSSSSFIAPIVNSIKFYEISLTVTDSLGGIHLDSLLVQVNPRLIPKLNDTGIIYGANYPSSNNSTCIGESIDEQDCSHGRDFLANSELLVKTGNGQAGFDFTKLDITGQPLINQNQDYADNLWSCIRDNHTKLIWEVKSLSSDIHNKNDTYRWGGSTSLLNGSFGNEYDDWTTLVEQSNNQSFCGITNWRVPSKQELESIINYNESNPAIDIFYFPNTVSALYWTASPAASFSGGAWTINIPNGGGGHIDFRSDFNSVRLVSDEVSQ
jgi:hypothetical protein